MDAPYSFTTHWQIKAPLEKVWNVLYDTASWPDWWKGVIDVKKIREGDADDIGVVYAFKWKGGNLPYSLSFTIELKEKEKQKMLRGQVSGELEGQGHWRFEENDGVCHVYHSWQVRTKKEWMTRFAWLLRPVFRHNHDKVMEWGAKGLANLLNATLISF